MRNNVDANHLRAVPRRLLLAFTGAIALAACASTGGQPTVSEREALQGKTVVITGASSGFGRGLATAFAERGANVVLAARRMELLEQVAAEARLHGVRALPVKTDVGSDADIQALRAATLAEFGGVDVWINNAGVVALGRFDEVPVRDHERVIQTNLMGVIYGSYQALRQFRQQGSGVLINMGSTNSQVPMPYYASYIASKHAILGFGNALNQELSVSGERNIHVVTVMPWAVDTPIWDHAANYTGRSPRQALMDGPREVIDAVVQAAIYPEPEVMPGWKAKAAIASHRLAPRTTESIAANVVDRVMMREAIAGVPAHSGNLHHPMEAGRGVEGGIRARMREEDERKKME